MVSCDSTFGLSQSKSRAPVRDRFRQFPVATRFDTLWAMFGHSRHFNPLICSVCSCSQTGHVQTSELPEMTRAPRHFA